ncbi:MAG: N-acetylmuramoyl-L-alanine amidase [Thermodesulfobacteriota bacterium]
MRLSTAGLLLNINKKSILLTLLSLFAFFALAATSQSATKSRITSIRHWSNPDYTRVVIDLTKKTSYKHHLLKKDPSIHKPRRFFIDIKDSSPSPALSRDIAINDGLLLRVRSAQHNKTTSRVVIDIESIDDYKVFSLNNPFRIIIDMSGKHGNGGKTPIAVKTVKKTKDKGPLPSKKSRAKRKKLLIVLDPGHGGKDPGAIGRKGLREKDVTLKIARLVAKDLQKQLKGSVVMTRKRDTYVALEERTAIANSRNADLFVSIHINASRKRSATGVETYILNLSTSEEARRLAARENATTTRGISDLEFILRDLVKTAKTNDSVKLASSVQGKLVTRLRRKYSGIKGNGVKGAPFYVLVGTRMPSILVEVSFISNSREEKRLRSAKYLKEVASGISTGVVDYLKAAS